MADVVKILDWSGNGKILRALVGSKPEPCLVCGRPAWLRAPSSKKPLHKVCAEARPDLAAHWGGAIPAGGGAAVELDDASAPF